MSVTLTHEQVKLHIKAKIKSQFKSIKAYARTKDKTPDQVSAVLAARRKAAVPDWMLEDFGLKLVYEYKLVDKIKNEY